jgi:hypothetical protein
MKLPCFHREHSPFHTNRRRLNSVAILTNVFIPVLVFCLVFGIVSFQVHFAAPWACYALVALIFLLTVGVFGALAQLANVHKHKETEDEHSPMWYNFLAACCLLAIIAGVVFGLQNYSRMETYYNYHHLNTYTNVDPGAYVGEQLVDAGRVTFKDDVHLDISHSMGFKSSELYCVAPIVSPGMNKDTHYDFWAVGKNCCSGVAADFHCQGFKDAVNMGGLRLMNDAERPFYRLAVQQAEATYKITTHKPLFFIWQWDVLQWTEDLRTLAYRSFFFALFTAFVVQIFLVMVATLVFAKDLPNRQWGKHGHGHDLHL